ncbi:LPXTG cell wall anchor domain-containing protein [Kitasatospora sp. NPDC094028]
MKLRRGLAIPAVATLVSAAVIAAAPVATAAGAVTTTRTDTKGDVPIVAIKNVPSQIVAGGPAAAFTVEYNNTSGHDVVFLPYLAIGADHYQLNADHEKIQYQDVDSKVWRDGTLVSDPKEPLAFTLLGSMANRTEAADDAYLYVSAGESLSIQVRLSLTGEATLDSASVMFVTTSFDPAQQEPLPVANNTAPTHFTIVASGGGTPKPSTSPTPASPSPTATPTATTTATASASATASAGASPTGGATSTPTKPAPATSAPTAVPSPTGGAVPPVKLDPAVTKAKKPSAVAVANAKSKAASRPSGGAGLATTGGGSNTTAIALTGAGVVALGAGTLVFLRRRKTGAGV